MAMKNAHKLGVIGIATIAAVVIGISTFAPPKASKYSDEETQQAFGTPVENAAPVLTPSDALNINVGASDVPEHQGLTQEKALSEHIQQVLQSQLQPLLTEPPKKSEPLLLDVGTLNYLSKSSEVALETLDAQVREQKLRGKAPQNTLMNQLGLGYQPSVTQTATSTQKESAPRVTATLGSIMQVEEGAYSARLYYQGRWHKVRKDSKIDTLQVQDIQSERAIVRVAGKRHVLTLGGAHE